MTGPATRSGSCWEPRGLACRALTGLSQRFLYLQVEVAGRPLQLTVAISSAVRDNSQRSTICEAFMARDTNLGSPGQQSSLTSLPAWRALAAHVEQMRDVSLRSLFAGDSSRGERFTVEAAGLYLDYSKNRITSETVRL